MKLNYTWAIIFAGICLSGAVQADVNSDFESGIDGWVLNGSDGILEHAAGEGVDGSGALLFDEQAVATFDYAWAPAKFLGDLTQYETFSFDFKTDQSSWDYNLNVWFLTDLGASDTQWNYNFGTQNTTEWNSYSLSLQDLSSANWVNNLVGSGSTLEQTLQNCTRVSIDLEIKNGTEYTLIDNISLIVPEPATAGLLAISTVFLLGIRRFYGRV